MKEGGRGGRRIITWFIRGAGIFFALLVVAALVVPRIINTQSIKGRIQAAVSPLIGGTLEFQNIRIVFLPHPSLTLQEVQISIPGKAKGVLSSLSVYPKIIPLFSGKVKLAKIQADAPEFTLMLPEGQGAGKREEKPVTPDMIKQEILSLLGAIGAKVSGLTVEIDKGRLSLGIPGHNEPLVSIRNIDGYLHLESKDVAIKLNCTSNLWERLSADLRIDPEQLKGGGTVSLTQFQPQPLIAYLSPSSPYHLEGSLGDTDLSFTVNGLEDLQAKLTLRLRALTLSRESRELVIKSVTLKGAFQRKGSTMTASLDSLDVDSPRLSLTGTLHIDQAESSARMEMNGKEVDVQSLRETALSFAGNTPLVRQIFAVVRGGNVSRISLHAQGRSLEDLGKMENIRVQGMMSGGKISLPGTPLDLTDVSGDVVISEGILEGKNCRARFGNTSARNGSVRVGLQGKEALFHLDILLSADLAQIPPILQFFIRTEAFQTELSKVEDLRGSAKGRLVLDGTTSSMRTRLDISDLNLSTQYRRVPFPLNITGGLFSYDENRVRVRNLTGTLGKSSFSELTAQLDLKEENLIDVVSGEVIINLSEVYPWFSSLGGMSDRFKDIRSLDGVISVSSLYLKGTPLHLENLYFSVSGEMNDIVLDAESVPGRVSVRKGKFTVLPDSITLSGAETTIVDASIMASGVLRGYRNGLQHVDATVDAVIGDEATQWILQHLNMPKELIVRAPLSVTQVQVSWDKDQGISFKGNIAPSGGPSLAFDVQANPKEIFIQRVSIQDEFSKANLSLHLKEREWEMRFSGDIDGKTLAKLSTKQEEIPSGSVKGDFYAHHVIDRPMQFTAQGNLEGEHIILPASLRKRLPPLTIEGISLKAAGKTAEVASDILLGEKKHIYMTGDVGASEEGLVLDMEIASEGLAWEEMEEYLGKDEQEKKGGEQEQGSPWNLPIRGTVGVNFEHLTYKNFILKPALATVFFSHEAVRVDLTDTGLCGIATQGSVILAQNGIDLDLSIQAEAQQLEPAITCLTDKSSRYTGIYSLTGRIAGQGKGDILLKSLKGGVEFISRDGRIYQEDLLSRIFAFLNVTELFRLEPLDLGKKGFGYNSISIRGDLGEGTFVLQEAVMDGLSLNMAGRGDIDLARNTLDIKFLVSPLKTVDAVVSRIPIVKNVTGGTLLSIPVRVSGNLKNPEVSSFALSDADTGLIGIVTKTMKKPLQIIEPSAMPAPK